MTYGVKASCKASIGPNTATAKVSHTPSVSETGKVFRLHMYHWGGGRFLAGFGRDQGAGWKRKQTPTGSNVARYE